MLDDVCDIFAEQWEADANFCGLASSTDMEDAVEGSVTIDKILLAQLVKKAAGEHSRVGNAKVGDIARIMHHAAKRYGVDRRAIAARKAEYLAISPQSAAV